MSNAVDDLNLSRERSTPMAAQQARESSKLLLTVPEAAQRLGIGRTLMYELISTGQVKSVHVGRLRRVRPADLEEYTAQLDTAPNPADQAA